MALIHRDLYIVGRLTILRSALVAQGRVAADVER